MNISKDEVILFRKKMEEAMAKIGEEMGLQLKLGNISYSDLSFSASVKGDKIQSGGKSVEQLKFNSECLYYGLFTEDFGKEFKYAGQHYKLVSINNRAKTYPLICENIKDGKKYKMALAPVRLALGKMAE